MKNRRAEPPLVLPRQDVMDGIAHYCKDFVELLQSLEPAEWCAPSRCEGWEVRDVAGHVAGLFTDVAVGRMAGQGLPEVTARQAAERRHRTPAEVAKELRKAGRLCGSVLDSFTDEAWLARAPGGFPGPLRRAVLVLWYELYVHGDDIRSAAGREPDRGSGLRAGVVHVAETLGLWGWGPATLRLDGIEELRIRGGGDPVTGDPRDFLLAATGRLDATRIGLDDRVNIYREVGT
ncbi:maleylpyruvate isomerase family mycothiol-dependent enzyme [Streptomyces sp. NPDC048434]|uniref:maleylpyruvate isomerase family mycothiol-dependent enzyme n=1 Tax=Streptomyces sp. NPDC048434 TaxID=3365549 RepID=UPI0037124AC7